MRAKLLVFRFVHYTMGVQNRRKFVADSKVNVGQFMQIPLFQCSLLEMSENQGSKFCEELAQKSKRGFWLFTTLRPACCSKPSLTSPPIYCNWMIHLDFEKACFLPIFSFPEQRENMSFSCLSTWQSDRPDTGNGNQASAENPCIRLELLISNWDLVKGVSSHSTL